MSKKSQATAGNPKTGEEPDSSPASTKPEFTSLNGSPLNKDMREVGIYRSLNIRRWQASAIYTLGGLAFAVIMTVASEISSHADFSAMGFIVLVWFRLWPVILVVNLVASNTRRTGIITVTIYFALWVVLNAIAIAIKPSLNWAQAVWLWGYINLPATIILMMFLYRRVRAVGPMIFTFLSFGFSGTLVLGIYGGNALIHQSVQKANLTRSIIYGMFDLGISQSMIIGMFYLVTFLLMAVAGWLTLQAVKSLYLHRRLGDYSIVLDPIWLIFGLVASSGFAFAGPWWVLSGFIAFAVYKLVSWAGFAWLNRERRKMKGLKLLVLRVFSLGKRSEQLYSAISKAWRYIGNIRFITGPDLATSTVEPHNFLDYISGKLHQRFIDSSETLEQRLAQADNFPDLDGRYRILDFFCHDDTWKMVLSRLAQDSDIILMDLRKFSRTNAGCVFEINELVNYVPLKRVVFVIDKTTDEVFLRESIESAWKKNEHSFSQPGAVYKSSSSKLR